jgi:single-stranded-DNA-specific exonuclease
MNVNDKKKVWSLRYTPGNSEADIKIADIAKSIGVSEVVARLIYNRGYNNAECAKSFLDAEIEGLRDPYGMKDMDKAVARVAKALEGREKITVYGDYDVDGVTSVTLIYLYLKSLGADVDYYIPLRAKEGYGLSKGAIDTLVMKGTKLIITVDTGITANKETAYAAENGIDMVITDHHECHGELPVACAVVNPHRPDCEYRFKELAGVGVIFKFVCAYEIARRPEDDAIECVKEICKTYIDLVAVGTVADVMPLIDENRVIVKLGLSEIDDNARTGLAALIEAASSMSVTRPATGSAEKNAAKKRKINSGFISFSLAPRINAAGRISSAEKAVELLLAENSEKAALLAEELCEINLQRQREENRIAEQAYKIIEETHDFKNDKIIVIDDDTWQQGIIGIVSSRITEKYGLPSILITFDGSTDGDSDPHDVGKGSGRSIKGMNLVGALDHCRDLLVQFGGHELAAGLSVMRCNIDAFRRKINAYAAENLPDDVFDMKYEADCEISSEEISMDVVEDISRLEPFGVANQTPLFLVKNMILEKIIPMGSGKHTKLLLSKESKSFSAVCFGMSASTLDYHYGESVDLLCQLSINEFRGQKTLQLVVQDIRLSPSLAEQYENEKAMYREISEGKSFFESDEVLPTRSDIAAVYKFLRYENMCGRNMFSYRDLRCAMYEQQRVSISCVKLRFIVRILTEIKVCDIEEFGDDIFSLDVCKNAAKTNIELSDTYKRLEAQCKV